MPTVFRLFRSRVARNASAAPSASSGTAHGFATSESLANAQGGIGVFEHVRTKDRFALVLLKNEYRFRPSVYFVERRRPKDSVYPDRYGLFGGKIEEGETARECAVREVLEETGVQIAQSDLVALLSFSGENDVGDVNEGEIFLHTFIPGHGITLRQIKEAQKKIIERAKDPDDLPGEPIKLSSLKWWRWGSQDWLNFTPQAIYALIADRDREARHKKSH